MHKCFVFSNACYIPGIFEECGGEHSHF